ncbi:DNA-binding transcriptional LysR family regulator [Phyllobacterium ifriqiyense]|uniref:DNA-binding transcriptional LysR family regulator n=2 Tax=Phyllobacteriaceae TaxID=69277 RepID=A0ABU0S3U7_9HYPH|nr:LysR substrate-binding domain-containing protein [Phyllobacterium ifriqiyense]MDQ0995430.1 DNA-binding transcriptional LysR family regulator [Phyllobacterium ifriqiyense]
MEALHGAVLRRLGIGCMPDFLVTNSLRTGELMSLLVDHLDAPGQFNLIWPSSRHLSPKVWVFVDFISEKLFSTQCQLPPRINEGS